MGRVLVLPVVFSLVGSLSGSAAAAGDCPPGDWFCEPAPAPGAPPPSPGAEPGAAGPAPAEPPLPPSEETEPEAEPRIRIDVENVKPAKRRRHFREWGVNAHATLGLMGNGSEKANDAGMNGLGGALRFRPIPHLAIEGSLDFVWGTDYRGFDRFESAFFANALFFANPRSAVQLYGIAGLGFSNAWVEGSFISGTTTRDETDEHYSYFGGQLGFGVEGRITRRFAVGADLLGFIRERTDRHSRRDPEFVDPESHRTTNASGGGLIRLGATFYW